MKLTVSGPAVVFVTGSISCTAEGIANCPMKSSFVLTFPAVDATPMVEPVGTTCRFCCPSFRDRAIDKPAALALPYNVRTPGLPQYWIGCPCKMFGFVVVAATENALTMKVCTSPSRGRAFCPPPQYSPGTVDSLARAIARVRRAPRQVPRAPEGEREWWTRQREYSPSNLR